MKTDLKLMDQNSDAALSATGLSEMDNHLMSLHEAAAISLKADDLGSPSSSFPTEHSSEAVKNDILDDLLGRERHVFHKREHNPTVSVIIPCYNGEDHIRETIASVLGQSYGDLEVIVVDDCSCDNSVSILREIATKDSRLRLFVQHENSGVAKARNRALSQARGRFIAYLDSDDLWMEHKLENQLAFMLSNGYSACFTSYETIEENGVFRNVVHVPVRINYRQFLKNTVTCSHTAMFDTAFVDKSLLQMPNLRRGQDFATWLQVARAGHDFYGLDVPLAKYRKTPGSLSSDKVKAIKRTWHVYRAVEHLSVPYAVWCQCLHLAYAAIKRIKTRS